MITVRVVCDWCGREHELPVRNNPEICYPYMDARVQLHSEWGYRGQTFDVPSRVGTIEAMTLQCEMCPRCRREREQVTK